MASENWLRAKLGDVAAEITVGYVGPMAHEYTPVGIPFLRSQNVKRFGLDLQDVVFVTEEFHVRLKKSSLRPGDVVIVRTGDPGAAAVIPDSLPTANCADLVIVRPGPNLDARFLMYFINAVAYRHVDAHVVGAVQQHFNVGSARVLDLPVPPLSEQRAIAHTLGILDEKIELNRLMNRTLKAMAEALFKSWFVEFDPVVARGTGKRPFGLTDELAGFFSTTFEDSSLGPVPQGWRVGKLRDGLRTLESGTRPKGGVAGIDEGVPSIGAENVLGLGEFDHDKTKFVPRRFFEEMKRGVVQPGDVLLYKDGAQVGRKSYFDCGFPYEECCVNEHVFILRPNEALTRRFLFLWLDQAWVTEEIALLNSNSAQPGLNQPAVGSLPILYPPRSILAEFERHVAPLTNRLLHNCKERRTLEGLRNALLPQLLSGEMTVSRVETLIEQPV